MKLFFKCNCCGKKNNICELILDQAWKEKDYQSLLIFFTSLQANTKEKLLLTLDEFEGEKEKIPQSIQEKYVFKKEKATTTTEREPEAETEEESNWVSIHPDFNYQGESWETNYREQWEQLGFTYQTCQEWIKIGLKPNESDFANWLANNQGFSPETVLNNYDYETLKRDYESSFDLDA